MKQLKPAGASQEVLFPEGLDPQTLRKKLWRYQKELGRKFDLEELLKIEDIRTRMMLVDAISRLQRFDGTDPEKEGSQ